MLVFHNVIGFLFFALLTIAAIGVVIIIAWGLGNLLAFPLHWLPIAHDRRLKFRRYISRGISIAFIAWFSYMVFTAIYPNGDFYLKEFEHVTLRSAPPSAKVTAKGATFPFYRGEYCSYSHIQLSKLDYEKLIGAISSDSRFREIPAISIQKMMDNVIRDTANYRQEEIDVYRSVAKLKILKTFVQKVPELSSRDYTINFLDDKSSIIVDVCHL